MPPKGGTPENLKPAKKGEVRNPKGRPKGALGWRKRWEKEAQKYLDGKQRVQFDGRRSTMPRIKAVMKGVTNKAIHGDVRAAEFMRDTSGGKPDTHHTIEGDISAQVAIDGMSEFLSIYREYAGKKKKNASSNRKKPGTRNNRGD